MKDETTEGFPPLDQPDNRYEKVPGLLELMRAFHKNMVRVDTMLYEGYRWGLYNSLNKQFSGLERAITDQSALLEQVEKQLDKLAAAPSQSNKELFEQVETLLDRIYTRRVKQDEESPEERAQWLLESRRDDIERLTIKILDTGDLPAMPMKDVMVWAVENAIELKKILAERVQ